MVVRLLEQHDLFDVVAMLVIPGVSALAAVTVSVVSLFIARSALVMSTRAVRVEELRREEERQQGRLRLANLMRQAIELLIANRLAEGDFDDSDSQARRHAEMQRVAGEVYSQMKLVDEQEASDLFDWLVKAGKRARNSAVMGAVTSQLLAQWLAAPQTIENTLREHPLSDKG